MKELYKTRSIHFLGLWELNQWKLKTYGISYTGDPVSQILVDAAEKIARERLSKSAVDTNHYSIGFIGIHEGKTGNFIFIDWWADENELHHHVYVSSQEKPEAFEYMTPSGLTACVWDLFVIGHERDAWVDCVLKQHGEPGFECYLNRTIDKVV
jgi:hypothetical protein